MVFDEDSLNRIYDRTDGRCHICGKKLSFINYADFGKKGAWEVEHSIPKVKGGTDHLNNLYAACISCNRKKGAVKTKTARSWHGRRRAPISKSMKKEARVSNAFAGGAIGIFLGMIAGPFGAVAGAALGATLGYDAEPDKNSWFS